MKQLQLSKKILIVPGIFIIGFCILYYFVFVDIKNRNERISLLEHELKRETTKSEYITSLEHILVNADSDIARINNSIIPNDGDVEFIENLEKMARENNLLIEINSLVFENNSAFASTSLTLLKINAQTKGDWLGSYTFLNQIESLPIKVKIKRFDFTNSILETNSDITKSIKSNSVWQSTFEIFLLKYKDPS